jgi:hypothetical protein
MKTTGDRKGKKNNNLRFMRNKAKFWFSRIFFRFLFFFFLFQNKPFVSQQQQQQRTRRRRDKMDLGALEQKLEEVSCTIKENSLSGEEIHQYMKPLYKEGTTCRHIYCSKRYNDSDELISSYPKNCGPCFISVCEFIREHVIPLMSESLGMKCTLSDTPKNGELTARVSAILDILLQNKNENIFDIFATRASTDITVAHLPFVMDELVRISCSLETQEAVEHLRTRGKKRKIEQRTPPKAKKRPKAHVISAE